MKRLIKKIEASDIFLILGLCIAGTGLYMRLDLGTSFSVTGIIILLIGLRMAPKRKPKPWQR
jgi:hypothetical protein